MTSRFAGFAALAALVAIGLFAQPVSASTHLVIPHFSSVPGDGSYLEVNNTNSHEIWLDLAAFGPGGRILGTGRTSVPAETRARIPLRDVFDFNTENAVAGWIEAYSADDQILINHGNVDGEEFEAVAPREASRFDVGHLARPLVRVANPNGFLVSLNVNAFDASGTELGERELFVGESGQVEIPANDLWDAEVAAIHLSGNGWVAGFADEDYIDVPGFIKKSGPAVFFITESAAVTGPSLRSVRPNTADIGVTNLQLQLLGQSLGAISTLKFVRVSDSAVNTAVTVSITRKSNNLIVAKISIASGALDGEHKLTLVPESGADIPTDVKFKIQIVPDPDLKSPGGISPKEGMQGTKVTFRLFAKPGTKLNTIANVKFTIAGQPEKDILAVAGSVKSTPSSVYGQVQLPVAAEEGDRTVVLISGAGTAYTTTTIFKVNKSTVPTITSIDPNIGFAGGSVPFTMVGTNFLSGLTTLSISGGGGIVATGVTVAAGWTTSLTGAFAISATAPLGPRSVVARTKNGTSKAIEFVVTSQSAPTLSTASPATGKQGQTKTITLTGADFVAKKTTVKVWKDSDATIVEDKIVVGTTTVATGGKKLTVSLEIKADAALGTKYLTVTTPGITSTRTSNTVAFDVVLGAPAVTSISPVSGFAGDADTAVTITGENFPAGGQIVIDPPTGGSSGITISDTQVVSNTQITAKFTTAANAAGGRRTVKVSAPDGMSPTGAAFDIKPKLDSISPTTWTLDGTPSKQVEVTLNGSGFTSSAQVVIASPTNGVTLSIAAGAITFVSATQLKAKLIIEEDAFLGARNVSVTTCAGGTGSACTGGTSYSTAAKTFTIAAGTPEVTGVTFTVNPTLATANKASLHAVVSGKKFVKSVWGGTTSITVLPNTITHSNLSIVSATSLEADFEVDPTAFGSSGSITVTVTPDGGSPINGAAFPFVVYLQNPVLTSLSDTTFQPGDSSAVDINGTGLLPGPEVQLKDPSGNLDTTNLTVSINTGASTSSQLKTTFNVGSETVLGDWTAAVMTSAGTSNSKPFTVSPCETTLDSPLSPALASAGDENVAITITGTCFSTNLAAHANNVAVAGGITISDSFDPGTPKSKKLEGKVNIPLATIGGSHNVTVSVSGAPGAAKIAAFKVKPKLTSLATIPGTATYKQGAPGSPTVVHVKLSGGGFVQTASQNVINVSAASGITVTNTTVAADNLSVEADLNIAADTDLTDRSITVSIPGSLTSDDALTFTVVHGTPVIDGISPSAKAAGSATGDITISGHNLKGASSVTTTIPGVATATISGTPGLTSLTASFTVPSDATGGKYAVNVVTPGGASNSADFTVQPRVDGSYSANRGGLVSLPLNGGGFVPTAGQTAVSVSGTGITAFLGTVSATQVEVVLNIASDATLGDRTITVTTGPSGSPFGTATATLTVLPATPTVATSGSGLVLGDINAGTNVSSATLTLAGTNFLLNAEGGTRVIVKRQSDSTTVFDAAGTVAGATSLTATFDVSPADFNTTYTVQVKVGTALVASNTITLTVPTPTPTLTEGEIVLNEMDSSIGTLTLTGTNFITTAGGTELIVVRESDDSEVTVSGSITVTDATSLTATLTLAEGDHGTNFKVKVKVGTAQVSSNEITVAVPVDAP